MERSTTVRDLPPGHSTHETKSRRPLDRWRTIVLSALAASVVAGTAVIGISAASATTYYSCLAKNGTLGPISTTSMTCGTSQTLIFWNQQGPPGNAGANVFTSATAPNGSCTTGDSDIALDTGEVYQCKSGAWTDSHSSVKGPKGADGVSVTGSVVPSNDPHCANGGVALMAVGGTFYVCNGSNGQNGAKGADGVSVTSSGLGVGDQNCPNGGSSFTSASGVTYACNGATGNTGPAGTVAGSPCNKGYLQGTIAQSVSSVTGSVTLSCSIPCTVVNAASAVHYNDAQSAVNAANNNDTIDLGGDCIGNTTISGKTLTLVGTPVSGGLRLPITWLDAGGSGTVLTLTVNASVTITDLLITNGNNGGIVNNGNGNVTLTGVAAVENNSSADGGGIHNVQGGSIILDDQSQVSVNKSSGNGGGISNDSTTAAPGPIVMNGSAYVGANTAVGDGGGIYNPSAAFANGSVTMNDSSQVGQNAASFGGGIFNIGTVTLNGSALITANMATGGPNSGGGVLDAVFHPGGGGISYGPGTLVGQTSSNITGNTPDDVATQS